MSQQILRVPEINLKTDDLNLVYKQQLSQIYAIDEKAKQKNAKKENSSSSSSSNCFVQKLLPIAVFLIAFSTVMTLLIIYVETFYLKYHEFKVNMTRDFVMNISQDDPQLIEYIRQIHIVPARRFLEHKNRLSKHLHKSGRNEHHQSINSLQPSAKLKFILALLGTQKNGVFIENNAYHLNGLSDTEWLEKSLSWNGLLIESNPEDFFNLQKHNRFRSQAIQACLSTCAHPKDIMYREETELRGDTYDSGDVRIHKLVDSNRKYFNSREKCFPLFSLMLASDFLHVDYLSLGYENGAVLDILKTLPFSKTDSSKFHIKIIDVNYGSNETDDLALVEAFLSEHNFVLVEQFDTSFIFFAQNSSLFITP